MAAPPVPLNMMGPPPGAPPGAQAGDSLTPEQASIVEIAVNDPMILQAIIQALMTQSGSGGAPLPPEALSTLEQLAGRQEPLQDKRGEMEKRMFGKGAK